MPGRLVRPLRMIRAPAAINRAAVVLSSIYTSGGLSQFCTAPQFCSTTMTTPGAQLPPFLQHSWEATKSGFTGCDTVHVVTGNEASDADSMCSSIALAFYKTKTAEQRDNQGSCYLPVMPIPRSDFALRGDTNLLFRRVGINPEHVVFYDEVPLPDLHKQGRLRITLTDHNAPSGPLREVSAAVSEIVDHHMDLHQLPEVEGPARDIAFDGDEGGRPLVGSCCTLVAERFLSSAPEALSEDVAHLLLGVILQDTSNLDTQAKRATQRDVDAVERLQAHCPGVDSDALFKELQASKFDSGFWRSLSTRDCLRSDYKRFEAGGRALGMSSVLCRLDDLLAKEEALPAIDAFLEEREISLLVVTTMTLDPPRREILAYSRDENDLHELEKFLTADSGARRLQLSRKQPERLKGVGQAGQLLIWDQGNVEASRKQLAPVFLSFLQQK